MKAEPHAHPAAPPPSPVKGPPLPGAEARAWRAPPQHDNPLRRVGAIVIRHWFLIRRSWPRLIELAYWPTVQLLVWGFLSQFLLTNSSWVAQAAGVLVGAVLLWEMLIRTQISMTVSFLEEMWSRNLGNLFVSPMRAWEWVLALVCMGVLRTMIGLAVPVALAFPLFGFNLFSLGLPLLAFYANLMLMGVSIALIVSGLILRNGLGAEGLAWMAVFILAPFSAVYYPVSSLPEAVQLFSLALPSTHVFEGMRDILFDRGFAWAHMGWALLLNLLYGGLAGLYFLSCFRRARTSGALLQTGE